MATRTFLPWTQPLLEEAVKLLLARYGEAGRVHLSDLLLVVPGARGGRRLMELLAQAAQERGDVLLPPACPVLTPGALPERLYDPGALPRPMASGAAARQAWGLAVAETPGPELSVVFPDPELFSGLAGRNTLARLLDSLNRAVGGAGKTFQDVARECASGLLFSDQDRWEVLVRIQKRFWSLLEGAGLMDRETARRLALRDRLLSPPGRIYLLGVAEMPGVLRGMLETISSQVEAVIHAPEALADLFDPLGLVRPEAWAAREIPLDEEILTLVDRPGDQASAVLAGISRLEDTLPPEEITVGVPDEAVVPFLEQRLEAYGIPIRYAGGSPLSRTAPSRFLAVTGEYLAQGSFNSLAELLRHPILQGRNPPWAGPGEADDYLSRHLPGRIRPGDLPQEAGKGVMEATLAALHGPDLLGPLTGTKALSAWMPEILALLARVFQREGLGRQAPEDRRLAEACLRIRQGAQLLHELPPALDGECQAADAIRILLGELEGDALPPEAMESAVELVGWLELHLDDAQVLFITGVNEGALPESVEVDAFLPNGLRSRLGLPDNMSRYGRDAYLLTAVTHSRKGRLKIISGRRNAGGDPLRPSRLLLTGEGPALARRVLRFAGEGASEKGESAPEPLGIPPASTSGFQLPPEPVLPVPVLPRPIPVTAFRFLLSDPYLWALQGILGLEAVPEDVQELDPLAFGSLAHRVLEIFGRSPEAASDDPERVEKRLHTILDQISSHAFGPTPLPSVPLQVAQLKARLQAFARWQAAWVGEGWRIHAVEARTVPEGAPFHVDGTPVFLSGRIDRIDVRPETAEWVIFDYKTGETAETPDKTHRNREGWKDLQLPLYRHLLPHLDGVDLFPDMMRSKDPSLAYLPLARKEGEFSPAFASWSPEELAEADETAREVIRRLREEGEVRFQPGKVGSTARGALGALLGRGALQEVDDPESGEDPGGPE